MDWRSVLHTGGVAASADGTTEGKYDPAVKVRKGGRILVKGLLDIWTALTTSLVKVRMRLLPHSSTTIAYIKSDSRLSSLSERLTIA